MNLNCVLESLIFASGKPIEIEKLAKICDVDEKKISDSLKKLNQEYERSGRGLRLALKSNEAQMVTASCFAKSVKKLTMHELQEDLSKVSLETLTIIAYKGPITRSELEAIRGVNCVYTLRSLLIRGLIEKKHQQKGFRVGIYEVTTKFLRHMGVAKISDLPNFKEVREKLESNKQQVESSKDANLIT